MCACVMFWGYLWQQNGAYSYTWFTRRRAEIYAIPPILLGYAMKKLICISYTNKFQAFRIIELHSDTSDFLCYFSLFLYPIIFYPSESSYFAASYKLLFFFIIPLTRCSVYQQNYYGAKSMMNFVCDINLFPFHLSQVSPISFPCAAILPSDTINSNGTHTYLIRPHGFHQGTHFAHLFKVHRFFHQITQVTQELSDFNCCADIQYVVCARRTRRIFQCDFNSFFL